MRTYQLSWLDRSYLEAETEATPFHTACLVLLNSDKLLDTRGRVRIRAVRSHVAQRWATALPLHLALRGGETASHPHEWEEVAELDIAEHVQVVRVRGRGTERDVLDTCARLLEPLMPRHLPMWRLFVLTGMSHRQVGLLFQVHHSVTDGMGGAALLSALMDEDNVTPLGVPLARMPNIDSPIAALSFGWAALTDFVTDTARAVVNTVEGGAFLAATLQRRPDSSLNVPVTQRRSLHVKQVALASVREIAHSVGSTINDVVLSAVAGSIGCALEDRGDRIDGVVLQALIPVSTRSIGAAGELIERGNHTSLFQVPLPIGIAHPIERVHQVTASTARRKDHHTVAAVAALEELASHLHLPGLDRASSYSIHHQPFVNVVITNVIGPRHLLRFMGARVERVYPFLPLSSDLPIAIAAGTYDGHLSIGVQSDPVGCPDAAEIAQGIVDQISLMHRLSVVRTG